MALSEGTRLGPYEILAPIGAGGMGEVYRAKDTKLGREVAIKVLPEVFSQNRERLARFQREARLLASLNHPNIAAIHELEESDGKPFLVLEFVKGENLQDRLKRGALAAEEGLEVCRQVAAGLEAAHEKGVIHRDLKPANVMITAEDVVKVLDFGLARTFEGELSESEQAHSPTITQGHTREGVILGTASYMSPEQARGKALDKRTDIWSFGCLLYEVLAGRKAYEGPTVSDNIAQILVGAPDWDALPAKLHPRIVELLRRCLQKESTKRRRDIGDVRLEIEEVLADPGGITQVPVSAVTSVGWRRMVPWVLASLVLGAAIGIAIWNLSSETAETGSGTVAFQDEIDLPEGERLTYGFGTGFALSPDGTHLAFASRTASNYAFGYQSKIYLRRSDQWEARPVHGTENASQPFFSPDGNWLGFVLRRRPSRLMKVDLSGGEPVEISQRGGEGVTWGPDDTIIFTEGNGRRLSRVSAAGGDPDIIAEPDEAAGEVRYLLPHFLPDGQSFLLTVQRYNFHAWNRAQIFAMSLVTGERKLLLENGSDARYVSTGHLVFAREGQLMAVPFDLGRLEVTGPEVPILEDVRHSIHTMGGTGAAQFSFSRSGMLAYAVGSVHPERKTTPVWVDRQGNEEPLDENLDPKDYEMARVSQDGRHVLLTVGYPLRGVWLYDRERGNLRPQTFDDNYVLGAVWGPGADHFTFDSDRQGVQALYVKKVSTGPGENIEKLQAEGRHVQASSWSPDGQRLAFYTDGGNIWILPRDGKAERFASPRVYVTLPDFSPDGKWIAYGSGEIGRTEIYVKPYPGPDSSILISTKGGVQPIWSRDGSEIFYTARPRGERETIFWSVKINVDGNTLTPSKPVRLFASKGRIRHGGSTHVRTHDVAPDGRFLIIKDADESEFRAITEEIYPTRIRLIPNWFEELKRLVPTDN